MDNLIKNNLFDIIPKSKIKNYLKTYNKPIPENFNNIYEKSNISEIYKNNKYKNLKKIVSPPYSFNIDIIHLPKYKNKNFILAFVDIYSRKSFIYILKNKSIDEIIRNFKIFVDIMQSLKLKIN
jgi:hypothetical protein